FLVETVDVDLEARGELSQVLLVRLAPADHLFRARRTRWRSGELHRARSVEEQRNPRAHAALRTQLDARLEQEDEDQERREQGGASSPLVEAPQAPDRKREHERDMRPKSSAVS